MIGVSVLVVRVQADHVLVSGPGAAGPVSVREIAAGGGQIRRVQRLQKGWIGNGFAEER